MKKFDLLLDGTTVLNFPMYFRLIKRFKKVSFIIFAIVLLFALGLNFFQKTIYYTSITFADTAAGNTDPSVKMLGAFLGGDNKDNNKAYQIIALKKSMDFTRNVATKLIENENFSKLRFDLSLFGSSHLKASEIIKRCNKKPECIKAEITELLPSFYEIFDRDRAGVMFTLEVKASDELTAQILIHVLQESINEARIKALKTSIAQQEKTNTEMLNIKEIELEKSDFYNLLEQKNILESRIKEIDDKIDINGKIFAEVKSSLANLESRVTRSRAVVGRKVGLNEIAKEKKRAELKERIEKLNKDLNALEITNFEYTEKDKLIIENLKTELEIKKKELAKLGQGNSSSNMDTFIKSSEEKLNSTELEYKVVKDQYETLSKSYDEYLAEKNKILEEKTKADQTIERLAPMAKYVKETRAKVDQLNLMASTIVSDVRFDIYPKPPEETKKISKILILAYSIVLFGFLTIAMLTIGFLLDDKIYDEEDLKEISDDLKIIGVVPKYD